MNSIKPIDFRKRKTSDTLVILGSGSSINRISDQQWKKIGSFNSIGFNWFCHHWFVPTFYVIREQANTKSRNVETETRSNLFKEMSKDGYLSTCLIIHDLSGHSPHVFSYVKHRKKFNQDGIIVRDFKSGVKRKHFTKNIFEKGVFHGNCTLTNVLHIGLYLKYKKIIFAGVDLYDSRYFWLSPKSTRSSIKAKRVSYKNRHPITKKVFRVVRLVQKHFETKLVTANHKSELRKIVEVEKL